MTNSTKNSTRLRGLTSVSLAAVSGMLLIAGGSAAHAQAAPAAPAAPAADAPDIVVTGYARSIQNAIRTKKLSTQIVESISAEDVGKLPDVSIADSLSRVPGVAVQTEAGRATFISIRGFSGDFSTATLNGRQIATVDDNRRFQFDQYPGDVFSNIDIIKTPSADLLHQGLAGTIDLKTYDPLTHKRTVSVNVQGELNGYSKQNPDGTNKGYKGTLIYIDKFANDTIGVSLAASVLQSPTQDKQYEAYSFGGDALNKGQLLGGGKWFANTNNLTRQSVFGHIVYKPDNKFEMSVDGFYSQSKTRELQRGIELQVASWSGSNETAATGSNGYVNSATFSNVQGVQRNNFNTRDADTLGLAWNAKYAFSDSVKLVVDANYSRAHRHDNAIESYSGTGYNQSGPADTINLTRQADGTYALQTTLNYTNTSLFKLTDPRGWGYYDPGTGGHSVVQAGYINEPDFTDTIKGLRAELNGQIHSNFFKSWELGVNYSDEKKTNAFTGFYLSPPGGVNPPFTNTSVAIPSVVGSVLPNNVTGSGFIAYDVNAAVAALSGMFRNASPSETTKQWNVEEKVLTGYAQVNFDTIAGSLPFKGNFGAQLVNTDQSSAGFSASSPTLIVPTNFDTKYTYVLPSANMSLEFSRNYFLRIGVGRTLARPKLYDENPSFQVSYSPAGAINGGQLEVINGKPVVLTGSGGNPYLRPYFSDYVDISVEKYFAHDQGKIAIAGYYKSITNYIGENLNYAADLSGYSSLIGPNAISNNTQGYISAPKNNGKGYVQGVEASIVLPLKVLTSALDGFGVIGSYAYTDSSIAFTDSTTPITLPGLSKTLIQGQVYFEKWGFNARVEYTRRGAYLGEYHGFGAQLSTSQTLAQNNVDAQIGYDFKSGVLNGLSLYVQGHNLTNSATVTVDGSNNVLKHESYGATYLAGATFKF
jgi:iron complex outermembrane receptor protein